MHIQITSDMKGGTTNGPRLHPCAAKCSDKNICTWQMEQYCTSVGMDLGVIEAEGLELHHQLM